MKRVLLLLALAGLPSCAVLGGRSPDAIGNATPASAGHHLELAQADLEAGRVERGLERLVELRKVEGLVPEERNRCEELLEGGVARAVEEASGPEGDAADLVAIYELDLVPRLKAWAGTRAADRMLAEGRRVDAVKMIRRVERALPSHPERAFAGDVLARAGFSLAADDGRYWLLFRYRSRGVEALEYLVLTYPFDHRCAQAYLTLAQIYEERDELADAIARYEDLLVFHPTSPLAVQAQARLPHVRLERMLRDDFDRTELELARGELEAWLTRYSDHDLQPWVARQLARCRERLAANDLHHARYYRRIGSPFGARLHAQRALEEAVAAGSAEREAEARGILEAVAEATSG